MVSHATAGRLGTFGAMFRVWSRQLVRRHRALLALIGAGLVLGVALGISSRPEAARAVAVQVVFLGSLALGLMTMAGIVTDDVASGTVTFWMQKRASVRRFYLRAFAARQALLLVVAAAMLALLAILVAPLGIVTWQEYGRLVMFIPILILLPSAIAFAMSGWGLTRDALAALIYIIGTGAVAIALARHDGALPNLVRLLTFPIDAIGELGRGAGRREGAPPPFVLIAGQYVVWVALGYLGIDRATRPRGGGGPARRA